MRCPQCGKRNSDQLSFCASCGNPLPLAPEAQSLGASTANNEPTDSPPDAATEMQADMSAPPAWRPAARPTSSSSSDRSLAFSRPGTVTLLAILQFFGAAMALFGAIAFIGTLLFSNDDLAADTEVALAIIGGICGVVSLLALACGIGLWRLKSYGRRLQLVLCWILLVVVPIGTIISIAILVYMYKPGVIVLFSGRPRDELTQKEADQLAAVSP